MTATGNASAEWRTAIADTSDHSDIRIRGYSLLDLIEHVDFASAVYLVLVGELPTDGQRRMLDMLLVSAIDHGVAPSAAVSRVISASGVPVQAAVAGGLLTLGDIHGGAGEDYARMLADLVADHGRQRSDWRPVADDVVTGLRAARRRLPGYGHPLHPDGDPRAPRLVGAAHRLGVAGPHIALATALEDALAATSGRRIPLNIDGALGSVMLDLGFSWHHARPLCIISRACGLAAHAIEERTRERGWRGIRVDAVAYDGPPPRTLPDRAAVEAGVTP